MSVAPETKPRWASADDPGLFGPGTLTWRIQREAVLLLGGGRALLLQVAHPSIAAAVAEHSSYRQDPWGRLLRTLTVVVRITFGDSETSARAAAGLAAVHRRVFGARPDGRRYSAGEPDLLLWVWATLVHSSLLTYGRYVAPLSDDEVEGFYAEQQRFALACGVPDGQWPESYAGFTSYFDSMIERGLELTPQAREIAGPVLIPPLPLPLAVPARPSLELLRLTTLGLLPPSLREAYGCEWGPVREAAFRASTGTMRRVVNLLPEMLRQLPAPR